MTLRSFPIAKLWDAEGGPVETLKSMGATEGRPARSILVPRGSILRSIFVGAETVYVVVETTNDTEEEGLQLMIVFNGQEVEHARYVGSFAYPFNKNHQRPVHEEEARRCIGHVVEMVNDNGHPRRTLIIK